MNPCSPAPKGGINWEAFERWVLRDHRKTVARDIVNYAKKYAHYLLSRDLREVAEVRKTKRTHVLKALSNLAKFLGIHDEYRRLIRNYGISWKGRSTDELIIDRLTKVKDPNEMFMWIKEVKEKIPDLSDFLDLMAISGLRLVEAISSYNLIIKLAKEGKLNQYYNEEKEALEHFRFKEIFLRKSKKAFVSFVPKDLVERIALNHPIPSRFALQKRLERQGMQGRFSDIREFHGTFMTKYLKESEINFIHGRVTTSVFMRNYFNPMWISDLKERVFKGISEIQALISL